MNGVIVVKAKSSRAAEINALSKLFSIGVFEILKVRELYNPIIAEERIMTDYEKSLLLHGIHGATDSFDVPIDVYNRITQMYEQGF
jgi:hypothetical protein